MSGAFSSDAPMPPPPGGRTMIWAYAGFWWRVLAWLVDVAILGLADGIIRGVTGIDGFGITFDKAPGDGSGTDGIAHVAYTHVAYTYNYTDDLGGIRHWHAHGGTAATLSFLITVAYFVLLESSRWQATLGKRVCGMRVTDLEGRRIGIGRACGRYFSKFVSWLLFCIGFLMVGWTRRKQGLHDMMAGTLVMRRREADPVFTFQEPLR